MSLTNTEIKMNSTSWFNSAFGSASGMLDRSEQLEAATIDVPNCGICLEKVSDPIALKCGHIFDKHCIKNCLASGLGKCPYDRKDVKESEFNVQHDIYESTKCRIKAAIFSSIGSSLISTDASIFSTMEKVQEKVISQYLRDTGKDEIPTVKSMTVRGSFKFYPGKTLADYKVMPGEETLMWVFLA
jgi:hypothetical protein